MFVIFNINRKSIQAANYKSLTLLLYYQGKLLTTIMTLEVSADFFNYAHSINPKIQGNFNLSLMSFVMSGNMKSNIYSDKTQKHLVEMMVHYI